MTDLDRMAAEYHKLSDQERRDLVSRMENPPANPPENPPENAPADTSGLLDRIEALQHDSFVKHAAEIRRLTAEARAAGLFD